MTVLWEHLVLHSAGLGAACLLALAIRGIWRKDPITCYRMLVILLLAALCLPVVQVLVHDQGHAWPGGIPPRRSGADRPSTKVIANDMIWEFFKAHPKR